MNELLKDYSQEEIESLARMQLENGFEEQATLKIETIDKEYKKNNKKTIGKAILNGSMILVFAGIVLTSNSNVAEFGTKDLSEISENIMNFMSGLINDEIILSIYSKMFDGLNLIVDKMGIVGVLLATKSIKFLLSTGKDIKKSIEMKKELAVLEKLLAKTQEINKSI